MLLENFFTFAFIACALGGIWYYFSNKKYKETSYYNVTRKSFLQMRFNIGAYGEYLTYENLRSFETDGAKFLFNTYIPKQNGGTSEIDVMMISTKGIFVFESKNYSGWIYGNEYQDKWCQTIKPEKGKIKKSFFYNPIKQNRAHVYHLQAIIGKELPVYSIIVFSNRCILQKIEVSDRYARVTQRLNLADTVLDTYYMTTNDPISAERVQELYYQLFPYTQVNPETKQKHITEIKKS